MKLGCFLGVHISEPAMWEESTFNTYIGILLHKVREELAALFRQVDFDKASLRDIHISHVASEAASKTTHNGPCRDVPRLATKSLGDDLVTEAYAQDLHLGKVLHRVSDKFHLAQNPWLRSEGIPFTATEDDQVIVIRVGIVATNDRIEEVEPGVRSHHGKRVHESLLDLWPEGRVRRMIDQDGQTKFRN